MKRISLVKLTKKLITNVPPEERVIIKGIITSGTENIHNIMDDIKERERPYSKDLFYKVLNEITQEEIRECNLCNDGFPKGDGFVIVKIMGIGVFSEREEAKEYLIDELGEREEENDSIILSMEELNNLMHSLER